MAAAKPDIRRNTYPALMAAGLFAALYMLALWVSTLDTPVPVKASVAAAAVAAFAGFLISEVRLMRQLDELERRIQLEALAVAFPSSIAAVMLLGLLERFIELPEADLSYRHVWPLMVLFYLVGIVIARRRYL